jgi:hypothetical protein
MVLPSLKPLRIIPSQNPPIPLLQPKNRKINLMLRKQKHPPRLTTQQIFLHRPSKRNFLGGVGAEYHHVGEIAAAFFDVIFVGGGFAVDAAGGEDGEDGVDYYSWGGEEEVSGVVLGMGLIKKRGEGGGGREKGRTIAITPPGFRIEWRSWRNSNVNSSTGSAPPVKTSCTM